MTQQLTLIGFHAAWCGACKLLAPVLTQIAEEDSDLTLRKVDVAAAPEMAERMGVTALPTLIVLNARDEECHRMSGAMTGSAVRAALKTARLAD